MTMAVPTLSYRWGTRRDNRPPVPNDPRPPEQGVTGHARLPRNLLRKVPVDLVFIERGQSARQDFAQTPPWEETFDHTPNARRPLVVMESWKPGAILWTRGPMSKVATTRWNDRGYQSRCRIVNALELGGAVDQSRLLVVRIHKRLQLKWEWKPLEQQGTTPRAMGNLLTPSGLVKSWAYKTNNGDNLPQAHKDPMPPTPGRWISTDKGVRALTPEEVGRGLGMKSEEAKDMSGALLTRTTSLFHWEYLMDCLGSPSAYPAIAGGTPQTVENQANRQVEPPFKWVPPDLSVGSPWYKERLKSLQKASWEFPDPPSIVKEGLSILDIHRSNYNSEGPAPTQLQLIWWEFPREHWGPLRKGSPMNFLQEPEPCMHPNSLMDEDQIRIAKEFIQELRDLGVLKPAGPGEVILSSAPLFCVPKEGQPGQWRVIADMLRGGQNKCIGSDPVFLPRVAHILDSLYAGGYSAVVDASKFFYQFPTLPEDRPHLGIVDPTTGEVLTYHGLPMGSRNSPALASRYGIAFLRKLFMENPIFQGKVRPNCYWTGFEGSEAYVPELGYGSILQGREGMAARAWVFVDDFLIHAQTYEECCAALTAFLDQALKCGLLCHPKKLVPPTQVVKYCGVILDTSATPTCRVPETKKERATAMLKHLLSHPQQEWSRLALAVVGGVLESLAECTPRRIGHTYLKSTHHQIHPQGSTGGLTPYLSCTRLSDQTLREMTWWLEHLTHGRGRVIRGTSAGTLVPSFGDGSGTGTGGTFQLPDGQLKMWKGKWHPCVHHYSSNWKELNTLKVSLDRMLETQAPGLQGCTLFYFTDNSTTYWICANGSSKNPTLHGVLEDIRSMEVKLGCHLVVIHVPGLIMIQEGTDGLSRGLWITPWHNQLDRKTLLSNIFAPLPFNEALIRNYVRKEVTLYHSLRPDTSLPDQYPNWELGRWEDPPHQRHILGRFTVWLPPPELARQVITSLLEAYIEDPLHTSGLLFIPRIVPGCWRGLSRCLQELPTVYPHVTDLSSPPFLPIPITVLYLPQHTRALDTTDRLDKAPPPKGARWHQAQAQQMRGMLDPTVERSVLPTVSLPEGWVPVEWA